MSAPGDSVNPSPRDSVNPAPGDSHLNLLYPDPVQREQIERIIKHTEKFFNSIDMLNQTHGFFET